MDGMDGIHGHQPIKGGTGSMGCMGSTGSMDDKSIAVIFFAPLLLHLICMPMTETFIPSPIVLALGLAVRAKP